MSKLDFEHLLTINTKKANEVKTSPQTSFIAFDSAGRPFATAINMTAEKRAVMSTLYPKSVAKRLI